MAYWGHGKTSKTFMEGSEERWMERKGETLNFTFFYVLKSNMNIIILRSFYQFAKTFFYDRLLIDGYYSIDPKLV